MKYKYILIPLQDNNGEPFSRQQFAELENRLLEAFGGFTDGGTVQGAWRSDSGIIYHDRSTRYEVAINPNEEATFLTMAKWAATHFGQEAILIVHVGESEIVGPGPG